MNYQHIYHAGNFADITKHAFLVALLQQLILKPKPLVVLDIHAGLGRYRLNRVESQKRQEYALGFTKLMQATVRHPALQCLQRLLQAENLDPQQPIYPGSPLLAQQLLRPGDQLVLVEKHPATCQTLRQVVRDQPAVAVHERDAYEALRALLPPNPRRGLILIDPPYEAKDEFSQLVRGLNEALGRFPQGVYLAWYPLKADSELHDFYRGLRQLAAEAVLRAEFRVLPDEAPGLQGSGLLVVNPPWQFADQASLLASELSCLLNERKSPLWRCDLLKATIE